MLTRKQRFALITLCERINEYSLKTGQEFPRAAYSFSKNSCEVDIQVRVTENGTVESFNSGKMWLKEDYTAVIEKLGEIFDNHCSAKFKIGDEVVFATGYNKTQLGKITKIIDLFTYEIFSEGSTSVRTGKYFKLLVRAFDIGDRVKIGYTKPFAVTNTQELGIIFGYYIEKISGKLYYNVLTDNGIKRTDDGVSITLIKKRHAGHKFKVGDEVVYTGTVAGMKNRIGIIKELLSDGCYRVEIDLCNCYLCEDEFTLLKKTKPVHKFKVGDEVVFRGNKHSPIAHRNGLITKIGEGIENCYLVVIDGNEWWLNESELKLYVQPKHKFKVDDEVRYTGTTSWRKNKIGKITELTPNRHYHVEIAGIVCSISENELKLINEEKPTPKFKKGDKVKYVGNEWETVKNAIGTITSLEYRNGRYDVQIGKNTWILKTKDLELCTEPESIDDKVDALVKSVEILSEKIYNIEVKPKCWGQRYFPLSPEPIPFPNWMIHTVNFGAI